MRGVYSGLVTENLIDYIYDLIFVTGICCDYDCPDEDVKVSNKTQILISFLLIYVHTLNVSADIEQVNNQNSKKCILAADIFMRCLIKCFLN